MPDTPETPLGSYIDHTNLRPDATAADIEKLCVEAIEHQLFAVCVNGSWVQHATTYLEDADVSIATVIGFPLGASGNEGVKDSPHTSKIANSKNVVHGWELSKLNVFTTLIFLFTALASR